MPETTANRLINEKSPYLLQHAHNPVDWYPWGQAAFNEAKRRDVPIFLSIGYSTCHWCHVMEKESFEDQAVAELLNQAFVCIKVDREERPDLDAYYMAVCQALTGSGGWPLTVMLTPERQAFYAGTYFPRSSRFGRPGLLQLVPALSQAWQEERDRLLDRASAIQTELAQVKPSKEGTPAPSLETLSTAAGRLLRSYDAKFGGFGQAPKFPAAHSLIFLLRYWQRSGQAAALTAAIHTLRQMGAGGIYDQVGFGFHRYSTDREWLLPHFEKMLYDQAMLAMAYLEAYQASGAEDLAEKAREVFTYVLRDLTAPEGGFYSAEDADSAGHEGSFYVWSLDELREQLDAADLKLLQRVLGVQATGNFRDQASGEQQSTNILHLTRPWADWAKELQAEEASLRKHWERIRQRLLTVRASRMRPHRDDKILTDWNGLMIAALALGGRVLQEQRWTDAAVRAMDWLLCNLRRPDGRWWKRYRAGEAALPAHLDDYAFTVWALLELHQTTQLPRYLELAVELNQLTQQLFHDKTNGGFYLTASDQTESPVRMKETYDGALPAGNSIAAQNHLRLARLTGDESLSAVAEQAFLASAADLAARPTALTALLTALDFHLGPTYEVVIVAPSGDAAGQAMQKSLAGFYQPRQVTIFRPAEEQDPEILRLVPYLAPYTMLDDRATAYVCSGFSCQAPTTDSGELLQQLGKIQD